MCVSAKVELAIHLRSIVHFAAIPSQPPTGGRNERNQKKKEKELIIASEDANACVCVLIASIFAVAFHSDQPSFSPIRGLYAAVRNRGH